MAGSIPRNFIADLLNRTDISSVIGDRIEIKRSGKQHKACCPFHKEKSPSFYIYDDAYHCFGCGEHGDAIAFLMEYERLEFVDAVETLAKSVGLEVPYENNITGQQEKRKPINKGDPTSYSVLNECAEKYYQQLFSEENQHAVQYLKERGLTGQITKQYRIGYAPNGWNFLSKPFTEKPNTNEIKRKLLFANSIIKKHETKGHIYDFFNDRIMFPIRDYRGRVIAFGGRVIGDGKPKYLNSPETAIFKKSQTLYGLYEARMQDKKPDWLLITEGYMDVVALAQFGIPYAVATLGTATSNEHIRLMFRYVPEIIFCFDGDNAGRKAGWKAVEACFSAWQDGKRIRFFFLPDGEDPDSLIRKEGKDGFLFKLKQEGKHLEEFFFEYLSSSLNLNNISDRTKLLHEAKSYINTIPKGIYFDGMLGRLADLTQLPRETVEKHLQEQQARTYTSASNTVGRTQASAPQIQSSPTSETPTYNDYEYAAYDDMSGNEPSSAFQSEPSPLNLTIKKLANRVAGLIIQAPELAQEINAHLHDIEHIAETELLLTCFKLLQADTSITNLFIKLQTSQHKKTIQQIIESKKTIFNHDQIKAEILDGLKQLQLEQLRQNIQIAEYSGDDEKRITLKIKEQQLLYPSQQ